MKSWFGATAQSVVSHGAVQALMAKWLQIKTDRDPTLADFWHDPDDAFADHAILFLRSESDYVYLHHGRYLRDRIGFSMQGMSLAELRTRIRAELLDIYGRCCDEFTLAYFQSFTDFVHEIVLWGRLCLPLRIAAKDPRVALLVYCHPIADRSSIVEAFFERSLASTVIAAPIRDDEGRIVDAWVVAQNQRAGLITGRPDDGIGSLLLRSSALFSRDDIWAHLIEHLPGRAAVASITSERQSLTLNVELIDEYLFIRATAAAGGKLFALD